jgi:16S rRNA (adenine1518-N6/adenine1519-N6)-dimethyltransferase
VRARRRFAQHFLEPAWVGKLVDAIGIDGADETIEIGPGRGALTAPLAARVRRLLAIEVDRDLARALEARRLPNLTVLNADVLRIDLRQTVESWLGRSLSTGGPVRLVGNLPYNISSPILFRLLDLASSTAGLKDAVLMLQKEVADRVVARPGTGEYGVLSILTALGADASTLLTLPPGAFRPVPTVTSAAIRLRFRAPPLGVRDLALLTRMVRSMFTQRRKTVSNALKPFAAGGPIPPGTALERSGIDPMRRPETLQLVEIARLADIFAGA